jgi:hypothetical protein
VLVGVSFNAGLAGDYRWQIIVRSPDPAALARDLPRLGQFAPVASPVAGGFLLCG